MCIHTHTHIQHRSSHTVVIHIYRPQPVYPQLTDNSLAHSTMGSAICWPPAAHTQLHPSPHLIHPTQPRQDPITTRVAHTDPPHDQALLFIFPMAVTPQTLTQTSRLVNNLFSHLHPHTPHTQPTAEAPASSASCHHLSQPRHPPRGSPSIRGNSEIAGGATEGPQGALETSAHPCGGRIPGQVWKHSNPCHCLQPAPPPTTSSYPLCRGRH